ncbi:MAG: hypothetical protein WAO41_07810 [Candidatus Nanopelagicales bacterium]
MKDKDIDVSITTQATAGQRTVPARPQVQVTTSTQGVPEHCTVRGWHYVVQQVHGHWVSGSPWWLTGVDIDTHIWRVTLCRLGGSAQVMDLRCAGQDWQVAHVGDRVGHRVGHRVGDR